MIYKNKKHEIGKTFNDDDSSHEDQKLTLHTIANMAIAILVISNLETLYNGLSICTSVVTDNCNGFNSLTEWQAWKLS